MSVPPRGQGTFQREQPSRSIYTGPRQRRDSENRIMAVNFITRIPRLRKGQPRVSHRLLGDMHSLT